LQSNLIDTHCHINFFNNAGDIALECEKRGISTIYVTTLPSQFDETFEYTKHLKYIHTSLGFHCLETNYNMEKEKNLFIKNIDKTDFIGEIGLDFSKKSNVEHDTQIELFRFVLESIQNKNKIINIHNTKAEEKVFSMLQEYSIKRAIFHWYSGKIGLINKIVNYSNGYYFSINDSMCKTKNGQNIISKIPKNRILVETDGPFIKGLTPYNNTFVYEYLSDIWDLSIEDTLQIVYSNFNSLTSGNNFQTASLF
jgi:TatD DNase family protein